VEIQSAKAFFNNDFIKKIEKFPTVGDKLGRFEKSQNFSMFLSLIFAAF